ncbi:MAG: extracellular solute-binding protein [Pseudomonadota bacterium]
MRKRLLVSAAVLFAISAPAFADGELNLYSSRHYDTDEKLYSAFEEKTGIKINRVEDSADVLIERMTSEGELSPADVLLTVDAGRIERANAAGLLQPLNSEVIKDKVPANLISEDDNWAGVTTRARIIFYDKDEVSDPPQSYEDLADPKYKGMICTRSSSNVYMIALLGSIIQHHGDETAKAWAEGLKNNLARDPEGGDTDQLRGLVSGECDIVVSNHYYFARADRKDVSGLTGSTENIGHVFPNQGDRGTHINISGAGIAANSPNPENARLFIEYLLTPEAQKMIADGNDEYPVVSGVDPSPAVVGLGEFKVDTLPLSKFATASDKATAMYNEIGYK